MLDVRENIKIQTLINECISEVINLRKSIHEEPELGFEEVKTTNKIKSFLHEERISIEEDSLSTGVVGVIHGEKPGPVIALRADIDALPLNESTGVSFSSLTPNKMHACGHDVHTAILLGSIKILNQLRNQIEGTVKFIFQPAEELLGGAKHVIKQGGLTNPLVDYVFGLHVWPDLPLGSIGLKKNESMASMDTFEVNILGESAHGATPHQGKDALIGASQIINNLQNIVSRSLNPLDSAVLTIGELNSGIGKNIIPGNAFFTGTVRSLSEPVRKDIKERFFEIVNSTSLSLRLKSEIEYDFGYPIVNNNEALTEYLYSSFKKQSGIEKVYSLSQPSLASEDFSYYLEKIPGCFFFLGVNDNKNGSYPLHNEKFCPSNEVIESGIISFLSIVLNNPYIKQHFEGRPI